MLLFTVEKALPGMNRYRKNSSSLLLGSGPDSADSPPEICHCSSGTSQIQAVSPNSHQAGLILVSKG